jgi:hypothetical protein
MEELWLRIGIGDMILVGIRPRRARAPGKLPGPPPLRDQRRDSDS